VAGNSLGGAIALELAAGGHAASATVFSPAGFYTRAEGRRAVTILGTMRATTFQPTVLLRASLRSPRVKARSFGPLVVHPERLSHERAVGDALALRRGSGFRSVVRSARDYSFAGSPDVPVTVAWGSNDHILQPHQAQRARERLPRARHVDLPGCGHVPMSDAPDLVARVVLETTGAVAPA
jgi:pimeloyl-ACP methyl ester carboxylesterase